MKKTTELRRFDQHCGTRRIFDLLSPKWRALIVCALGDGTHRYNELLRRIIGVSPKMLTESLRGLERDRLIERDPGKDSKKVEYSLTKLGRTVNDRLRDLCEWCDQHIDELDGRGRS